MSLRTGMNSYRMSIRNQALLTKDRITAAVIFQSPYVHKETTSTQKFFRLREKALSQGVEALLSIFGRFTNKFKNYLNPNKLFSSVH